MTIPEKIRAYHGGLANNEHHRYLSWEHCYRFFRRLTPSKMASQRDSAALQLGFYLASWGMYRGSSFLLQHAYTVHLGVIDCLAAPRFSSLWKREFGVPGVSAGKFTMGLLSPWDDVKRQSVEIPSQVVLTTNDATRYCSY